jgi:uncharacterized RDD family membrane protein YckC
MKCPKCGYLGFETTDRCRNCQYDFSLTPFTAEPELTLQSNDHAEGGDFDLPAITRQTDEVSPKALDLDQLFGADEAAAPSSESGEKKATEEAATEEAAAGEGAIEGDATEGDATEGDALPFDDAPIVPPPAARPPLAVRRATMEVPRNRPRPTRPARTETLQLEADHPDAQRTTRGSMSDTVASLMETPTLGARVGAGAIDTSVLVALDVIILYLTLRVAGLQNTMDDIRVLPVIPFAGFLVLLAFGYVAAFTVAGGQTIGKMVLSLRVIGDDGRPIDAAGGMLRAAGCMLVPLTFGLSYVPALVTADHRALHDRIAGTRVVRE